MSLTFPDESGTLSQHPSPSDYWRGTSDSCQKVPLCECWFPNRCLKQQFKPFPNSRGDLPEVAHPSSLLLLPRSPLSVWLPLEKTSVKLAATKKDWIGGNNQQHHRSGTTSQPLIRLKQRTEEPRVSTQLSSLSSCGSCGHKCLSSVHLPE